MISEKQSKFQRATIVEI